MNECVFVSDCVRVLDHSWLVRGHLQRCFVDVFSDYTFVVHNAWIVVCVCVCMRKGVDRVVDQTWGRRSSVTAA